MNAIKTFFEHAADFFKKAFGSAGTWDEIALTSITIAAPLALTALTLVDPAAVPIVQPIITKIQTDLTLAGTLISAGVANPTLNGALLDIKTNASAILQLAEVKNSANAATITNDINTVIAEIEAIEAALPKTS